MPSPFSPGKRSCRYTSSYRSRALTRRSSLRSSPIWQGNTKSSFTFNATLKNQTADQQSYALIADAPRGWNVIFKPNYKQATSTQIAANSSQNLTIEITPPANAEAGTYHIPVRAASGSTSAELQLEIVITGSFQMELTTPQGLLSSDITAGDTKRLELVIRNTGSSTLKDIDLTAGKPANWEVTFRTLENRFAARRRRCQRDGHNEGFRKGAAGDYVTTIKASTPEVNASAQFRISVRTPMLWGWVGVLITLTAIGIVIWLFRKYGRR